MGWFLLLWLGIFLLLSSAIGNNNDFNNWTARCRSDKGVVTQTEWGFFTDHYECYKDGKIIDHVN